jgi:hypothetical protein
MPPLVLSDDEVRQLQALTSSRSLLHSIVQRAQALLAALRTVPEAPEAASTAPADPQTQAEWADIRARLVRLEAEAHRRQAETTTAREALAKLPLARQRMTDVAPGWRPKGSSPATLGKTAPASASNKSVTWPPSKLAWPKLKPPGQKAAAPAARCWPKPAAA